MFYNLLLAIIALFLVPLFSIGILKSLIWLVNTGIIGAETSQYVCKNGQKENAKISTGSSKESRVGTNTLKTKTAVVYSSVSTDVPKKYYKTSTARCTREWDTLKEDMDQQLKQKSSGK